MDIAFGRVGALGSALETCRRLGGVDYACGALDWALGFLFGYFGARCLWASLPIAVDVFSAWDFLVHRPVLGALVGCAPAVVERTFVGRGLSEGA